MKKFTARLLALILVVMMVVPVFSVKTYAANPGQAGAVGIDVSKWQGNVNWDQVKASGVSFAFIKAYSSKGGIDPYFVQNVNGANRVGIRSGAYVYSYARTPEEAVAEANAMIAIMQNLSITFPVAIDIEDKSQKDLSPEQLAAIANAFCATVANAGYQPMVYANKSWFTSKIGYTPYDKWIAQYASECNYAGGTPCIWQASCTARIPGVAGEVDLDYLYKDYSYIIPQGFSAVGGYTFFYNNYRRMRGWVDYNGKRYYCDPANAVVRTGWLPTGDGRYYYLGPDGAMSVGFTQIDTSVYYFGADGIMVTGLADIAEQKYLFQADGKMYTGWYAPGDFIYYFAADGHMVHGWNVDSGKTYFFDADGHMVTGLYAVADKKYYFNEKGEMQAGWVQTAIGKMYFDQTGAMVTGLVALPDGVYYLDPTTGVMQVGLVQMPDGVRYFDPATGKMMTGFVDTAAGKMYFDQTGIRATGIINVGDGIYYIDPKTGVVTTGLVAFKEGNRYFDPTTGKMVVGEVTIGAANYYFNPATGVMTVGIVSDGKGIKYYDMKDGHMVVGPATINGAMFFFDPKTGYLVPNQIVEYAGHLYQTDANGVVVAMQ